MINLKKQAQELNRRGMSYSQIAKQLGVSKSTIGNYCKGQTRISNIPIKKGEPLEETLDLDGATMDVPLDGTDSRTIEADLMENHENTIKSDGLGSSITEGEIPKTINKNEVDDSFEKDSVQVLKGESKDSQEIKPENIISASKGLNLPDKKGLGLGGLKEDTQNKDEVESSSYTVITAVVWSVSYCFQQGVVPGALSVIAVLGLNKMVKTKTGRGLFSQ